MTSFKNNLKYLIKKSVYQSKVLRNLIEKRYADKPEAWTVGYSMSKFTYICNVVQGQLDQFKNEELLDGFGFCFDERVVEYPWAISKLCDSDLDLLDAGSALNHVDLLKLDQLKNRNISIVTLDNEGQAARSKRVKYFYEDLRSLSFPDESFDAVVCLSTLEHVGLDNTMLYTDDLHKNENSVNSYLTAVSEMKRVLRSKGHLYITVPFGVWKNYEWFQIFNSEMVDAVIREFSPTTYSEQYLLYKDGQWQFTKREQCLDAVYFDVHSSSGYHNGQHALASEAVVCLELRKD